MTPEVYAILVFAGVLIAFGFVVDRVQKWKSNDRVAKRLKAMQDEG